MTFVSFSFILFLCITIVIYFLTPHKYQWYILLAASAFFYWMNSHWLLLVLFGTAAVTFLIGLWIERINKTSKAYLKEKAGELSREEKKAYKDASKKRAKRVLILGVVLDLGPLLFLKYFNFFARSTNSLLSVLRIGPLLPYLRLLLPLGISFYTLQAIAYLTDIYRGKLEADRNLGKFMLFMSFFPQIVQGPIPRHAQLANQLYEGHSFDYKRLTFGIQLMMWGWMKKMIIADRLAIPADQLFDNYTQYSGSILFLAAILYGLRVYADFSGGMDIARGVSQILGIELELNFTQPYFAKSVEEFWRRWHITLGGFMRDYVFYPLSLSKSFSELSKKTRMIFGQFVGKRLPSFLASFIVYLIVGFWHGSEWRYIAYGIWNGAIIVTSILLTELYEKTKAACGISDDQFSWRFFQMFRTFLLMSIGRYFARAHGFMAAVKMMRRTLIKWNDLSFIVDGSLLKLGLDNANWILLLVFLLILFLVDHLHEKGIQIRESIADQSILFRWVIYIAAVLALLVFGIYGPGYDSASFIYEQF